MGYVVNTLDAGFAMSRKSSKGRESKKVLSFDAGRY